MGSDAGYGFDALRSYERPTGPEDERSSRRESEAPSVTEEAPGGVWAAAEEGGAAADETVQKAEEGFAAADVLGLFAREIAVPLLQAEPLNWSNSWKQVFEQHFGRFHPEVKDMTSLQTLGCPSLIEMRQADP